jgi:SagB-type dehydrogenase family enzyme
MAVITPSQHTDDVTRRAFIGAVAAMAMARATVGRESGDEEHPMTTARAVTEPIVFPPPADSAVPLETALRRRRSMRAFGAEPLTDAEVGQVLWAAQGITASSGRRTTPSAGALYPLEVYAITPDRTIHYLPDGHRGEITAEADLRNELMTAAGGQEAIAQAPLVVAVVAVPARTAARYGGRTGRFVDLEAGHTAQNVLLQAVALGLVAVPIGSFDDAAVADTLALPQSHEPRYLLAVGHPLDAD